MKKRTKNIIKGIFIPLAVTVSLLIAVGGFYWTKLDNYSSVTEKSSPVAQLMIPMMMF